MLEALARNPHSVRKLEGSWIEVPVWEQQTSGPGTAQVLGGQVWVRSPLVPASGDSWRQPRPKPRRGERVHAPVLTGGGRLTRGSTSHVFGQPLCAD